MVTTVVPVLLVPAARAGTDRLPRTTILKGLLARYNAVVELAAEAPPWFLVVSVMEMVEPAAALAGAERSETIKSGPIPMGLTVVLFVSTDSATTIFPSAWAMMK